MKETYDFGIVEYSEDEAYGGFPTGIELNDGWVQLGHTDGGMGYDATESALTIDEFYRLIITGLGKYAFAIDHTLPFEIRNVLSEYEHNNINGESENCAYGLYTKAEHVGMIKNYLNSQ